MQSEEIARVCFDDAVRQLVADYEKGQFVPLLEADVSAYLYYLMLSSGKVPAREIHLDTRVVGLEERGRTPKVDLAIGTPILVHPDTDDRSVIDADLAVEIKFLAQDMDPAEHNNQVKGADDDISKLSTISARRQKGMFLVMVADEVGYSDKPAGAKRLADLSQGAQDCSVDFIVVRFKSQNRPALRTTGIGYRLLTVGQKIFGWHKGEEYEAVVAEDGIVYEGEFYSSLSKAGCAATGQDTCDGPKFWNLR